MGDERRNAVLVVDDDADIREVLAEILTTRGYAVDAAESGEAALRALRAGPLPDLILLDLRMPDMNGWEFRRAQKGDPNLASVPVLVLSGGRIGSEKDPEIDAADVIAKPVDLEELARKVARHARGRTP